MHIPVLLQESIDQLHLHTARVVVDGTFGGGGHTKKMLDLFPNVKVICVDLDEDVAGLYFPVKERVYA
jgi:16S rRNA (cytosine1402-N4)-methyltransferase